MLVQSPVNSRRFRPQPWLLCPSFASASTTEHAPCKPRETHRERLTVASPRLERYADGQLNLAPLHEPFRATFPPIGAEIMSTGTDISALYREFTDALTEVLAENAGNPARRGRLARARAAVKRHPDYSEHKYFLAVETAFTQWEAMQNIGR